MAQDTSGAGAAAGGTLVIPGEMAARVDRLPMSFMAWEICLIVQVGWAMSASTDGIAARLYPFIWLPAKAVTHSQYDVLYAFQAGISIVIGGYAIGWLADKIGRRKALILSSVLAGLFTWPFGYVTDYPALVVLSIADTLGFAGYLAVNVVYMSEMMGPAVRNKVIMGAQVLAIVLLAVVLASLIPHYWIPGEYRRYLWLLAGLNIVVALALFWRMPESPRWLEARERRDQARTIVERMEARVTKRHPVLPEPDLTPHQVVAEDKTRWFAPFGRQYVVVTVFLLVVMVLGYGGIVYGSVGYRFLFLAGSRHYSAGFIFALAAWGRGGLRRGLHAQRPVRPADRAQIHPARRRHHVRRRLVGRLRRARHPRPGRLLRRRDGRHHAVAVQHVGVHPRQLPDSDALAGYRLDRRRGPRRCLGRRPAQRGDLHRSRAAGLDLADHHTGRAPARLHGRDLRETPAPPHARRAGPVDAGVTRRRRLGRGPVRRIIPAPRVPPARLPVLSVHLERVKHRSMPLIIRRS